MHVKPFRNLGEVPGKLAQQQVEFGRIKLHAHEKCVRVTIPVLVGMQDVSAVLIKKSGDAGDYTLAIGTTQKQDRTRLHHFALRSFRISRAALAPEPPVRPTPGWVPDPHR